MRTLLNGSMLAATAAVLSMTMIPAAGQAPAAAAPAARPPAARPASAYHGPRLTDGHPNLNGIWQTMNTANWDLQEHQSQTGLVVDYGSVGAEPGGSGVVDGGEIPYLPAALEQKKKNYAARLQMDPEVKCYLPGVPRANYMPYPFQIFHSTKAIFIAYQYDGAVRNFFQKDPGPAPADSWMGQSWSKWEGDTLVVDVTGLDERSWLDRAGNFHSDEIHVVERWTPVGDGNIINYEATITDPKVFSRPWKIAMPIYKHTEKNARIYDFKCVEFVEDLMYGKFAKKP